jgi:hypothetical protein
MTQYRSIVKDWMEVNEPVLEYDSKDPVNTITYKIIGCCFEVYNELGTSEKSP